MNEAMVRPNEEVPDPDEGDTLAESEGDVSVDDALE